MCTVLDDDLEDEVKFMEQLNLETKDTNCLKCSDSNTIVTLRGKDKYCSSCFQSAIDHKFRASLGKSRLLRHGDNVLIVYLGGYATSTMLKIIHNGLEGDLHKKFVFNPYVVYIDHGVILNQDLSARIQVVQNIYSELKKYPYSVYISTLSCSLKFEQNSFSKLTENCDYVLNTFNDNELINLFSNISTLSAKQDFLNNLQRKLTIQIAKSLNCKFVFLPEISTLIASKTLAGFALGRGSHITLEVGFSDTRDPDVTILRPMRDFSCEEVEKFCTLIDLQSVNLQKFGESTELYSSIQNLTDRFIKDLQENYPATIFTVLRTTDKLAVDKQVNNGMKICQFCSALKDNLSASDTLSALSAVQFSKIASDQSGKMVADCSYERPHRTNEGSEQNLFCYACSTTFKDFKNVSLLNNII